MSVDFVKGKISDRRSAGNYVDSKGNYVLSISTLGVTCSALNTFMIRSSGVSIDSSKHTLMASGTTWLRLFDLIVTKQNDSLSVQETMCKIMKELKSNFPETFNNRSFEDIPWVPQNH